MAFVPLQHDSFVKRKELYLRLIEKMLHNLKRSVEVAKKEADYVLYKYGDMGKAVELLPDPAGQRKI